MTPITQSERGFTLIEVTLAIVLGVVILTAATILYRQAAISAGNVKAQEKTQALAAFIEEFFVKQNRYPTHEQLRKIWVSYRPDALLSPWGGPLGAHGQGEAQGIAMRQDAFTTPWEPDRYYNPDYAGVIAYFVANNGAETKAVTDYDSGRTRTYRGYVVGMWNKDGHDPCFIMGEKFGIH